MNRLASLALAALIACLTVTCGDPPGEPDGEPTGETQAAAADTTASEPSGAEAASNAEPDASDAAKPDPESTTPANAATLPEVRYYVISDA